VEGKSWSLCVEVKFELNRWGLGVGVTMEVHLRRRQKCRKPKTGQVCSIATYVRHHDIYFNALQTSVPHLISACYDPACYLKESSLIICSTRNNNILSHISERP
jgi:hypothetical protein